MTPELAAWGIAGFMCLFGRISLERCPSRHVGSSEIDSGLPETIPQLVHIHVP